MFIFGFFLDKIYKLTFNLTNKIKLILFDIIFHTKNYNPSSLISKYRWIIETKNSIILISYIKYFKPKYLKKLIVCQC